MLDVSAPPSKSAIPDMWASLPKTKEAAIASGARWFFTGEPCSRGHIDRTSTRHRQCMECARLRSALNYRKPGVRERQNVTSRERYSSDPEYRRKRNVMAGAIRREKKKNAEYRAELNRRARERHNRKKDDDAYKAGKRAKAREWRLKFPQRVKRGSERYYEENRDKLIAASNANRARRMGAAGFTTTEEIKMILQGQGYRCPYCAKRFGRNHHVDHKTPLSRGGTNWPDNLHVTCVTCNLKKGSRTHEEYLSMLSGGEVAVA